MHYHISPDHPVFRSAAFRRDALLVEVLDVIIRPSAFLLLSDGEQFVVARNRLDLPAWVWTRDALQPETLDTLCGLLHTHFAGREALITVKEEAADAIRAWFEARGYQSEGGMGLIAYRLSEVKLPEDKGAHRLARLEELDQLAALYRDFQLACFGEVREQDCEAHMRQRVEAGTLRVLAPEGELQCLVDAAPRTPGGHSRVNLVYTRPEAQGRGYAKWLTARVCQEELRRCPFVILYADADNPRSNAAYRRVGFEPLGVMRELRLQPPQMS